MEHCLRWYGPDDPVSLRDVRQAGARGVVTALHHVANGDEWTDVEIERRLQEIAEGSPDAGGLRWSVVESLPVHEEIKRCGPRRNELLDTYCRNLERLGSFGIETVCYNFMPVLDWTRTDLSVNWFDGSKALAFSLVDLVAFDLFALQRAGAEHGYPDAVLSEARRHPPSPERLAELGRTIAAGLPGSEESYGVAELRSALADYADVHRGALEDSLDAFLRTVVPVAEGAGVRLAIHPDDPPLPLLGLPRVVSTASDLRRLLGSVESEANGLTFCTGSLGAHPENDVPALAEELSPRVHFVHLRNVEKGSSPGDFVESDHLDGDVDMVRVIGALLDEEERSRRALPMRPDHGHAMLDDLGKESRPGYSAIGRLRGLAELRGVEHALRASRAG
ncbi:MAG: mannonate dehydratase [Acidobacteriota bacterium]